VIVGYISRVYRPVRLTQRGFHSASSLQQTPAVSLTCTSKPPVDSGNFLVLPKMPFIKFNKKKLNIFTTNKYSVPIFKIKKKKKRKMESPHVLFFSVQKIIYLFIFFSVLDEGKFGKCEKRNKYNKNGRGSHVTCRHFFLHGYAVRVKLIELLIYCVFFSFLPF
jgi:hypothetical protein